MSTWHANAYSQSRTLSPGGATVEPWQVKRFKVGTRRVLLHHLYALGGFAPQNVKQQSPQSERLATVVLMDVLPLSITSNTERNICLWKWSAGWNVKSDICNCWGKIGKMRRHKVCWRLGTFASAYRCQMKPAKDDPWPQHKKRRWRRSWRQTMARRKFRQWSCPGVETWFFEGFQARLQGWYLSLVDGRWFVHVGTNK